MKKILRNLTAILLALVMFMSSSIGVLAAQDTYISDIKIGYGEEGRQALAAAGYNVWNIDANRGGIYEEEKDFGKKEYFGSSVYIGYKTTAVKEDAITDIAVMNMGGNYSYSDWADEVDAAWKEAERKVDRFQEAIRLFRENYRNAVDGKATGEDLSFPELAYQMLNFYYEDDTAQKVGDLFLNEDTPDLQLETVFMQGNATVLRGIEYYLALGCVEADGDTFLKRLAEADVYALMEGDEEDDADPLEAEDGQTLDESIVTLNQACGLLINSIGYTKETVSEYRQRLADLKNYDSEEEYLNSLDDDNKASYLISKQVFSILEKTPYGNLEGVTLLDIIELSDTTRNERGLVLNSEAVAPLARCMTAAQVGLLEFVGLDTLLMMADSVSDEEKTENYRSKVQETVQNTAETYKGRTVSVYDGVDRSLFTDVENIALTGEAVKNRVFQEGASFGRLTEQNNDLSTALAVTGGVCGLIGAVLWIFPFRAHMLGEIFLGYWPSAAMQVGTVICFAAAVVIIFLLVNFIKQKHLVYEDVNYTRIPRVLVDIKMTTNTLNKQEEKHYIPYYAAYNIQAAAGETNTTKLFGDLNGLSGKAQWLVLYYTKDALAGTPLKAGNLLVKDVNSFTQTELSGYRAIHVLGNTNPENLNQYHVNGTAALFAAVPEAKTSGGSIFTDSSLWNVIAGFGFIVAGGAAAMLLTKSYYKKKKKAEK